MIIITRTYKNHTHYVCIVFDEYARVKWNWILQFNYTSSFVVNTIIG